MARRRYQRGSVKLRGKREPVWVGRWREDVIVNGKLTRVCKKEVLGTRKELPTKRLALRELELRLIPINDRNYKAMHRATFAEFARIWQENGLSQHKLSTRSVAKSVIKCWLVPFFGNLPMRDICGQHVQMFVRNCDRSPRSCLSYILILRMMWNSAKAWRYCSGDPFEALILPERERKPRSSLPCRRLPASFYGLEKAQGSHSIDAFKI